MDNIHVIDYTVMSVYILGIFILAFYSGKAKHGANLIQDQYLAGKSLTLMESLCSIIATEVSALTFLGIPAYAYGGDYSFIQIYMGALFGRIIIAFIMLPKIYDQGLTVYTVMAKLGGEQGQKAIALFYSLNKFLAVGVRLFAGSIIISEFFDTSIYMAVAIICIMTFFYTLIGGLKAVVRTDMVQMVLFIVGGLTAHYLIPQVAGVSWTELMGVASSADKTSFISFANPLPFVIGVLGGILFDMATHGVDQDFVQRLTANRKMKDAQIAIISSTFVSIAVGLLFLGVGTLLWSYYQTNVHPGVANDKLFAYFITHHFPVGLKGLMVAGVLAATMSTLDSTINALSATFYNDIFKHKTKNIKQVQNFYKRDTLIITLILMLIAFIASNSEELLLFGLKITSWTAGSLLAVFFSVVIFRFAKLRTWNVVMAYIFGALGVYANTFLIEWDWNFNVYIGFSLGLLAIYITEKISSRNH
ncbi:MAG: hypothetical protein CME62_12980 [Halobacteriovoraceae bacterium]|nr:hypothetical protein [Halobacteriovoraceae bacterium]